MSIPFPGFTGLSYQTLNKYATIERTVNFYAEANESQDESKEKLQLLPCPVNAPFCALPVPAPFNQPGRGMIEYRNAVFGVSGDILWTIDETGTFTNLLTMDAITNDGKPIYWAPNGNNQIFLCAGGYGFVIMVKSPASTSTVQGIAQDPTAFLGASYATFQDGYALVITPGTNQFQISGTDSVPIGDMTLWDAANISVQAGQADNLVAMISSREYIRILGQRRSQVYQNVGAAGAGGFPFQSFNETFIETGCASAASVVDLGDSLCWIGEDIRGQRAFWRDYAFQPRRESTFAVEQIWQQYPTVADAVSMTFIWMGHLFVQVTFPTAKATWLYDATTSQLLGRACWSERTYIDYNGNVCARSEQFHAFCFGKHLVLSSGVDGNPGAVYQYTNAVLQQANPQLLLRWSNDGGNTWGSEYQISLGLVGEFSRRVYLNRCGYGRDRVFWVRTSETGDCGADGSGAQIVQPVVRDRICPHLWENNKRIIYNRIEFECNRGVGYGGGSSGQQAVGFVAAELDLLEMAS